MFRRFERLLAVGVLAFYATTTQAQDTVTVGYSAEWPLPALAGISSGAYDTLDRPVQWKRFLTGESASRALLTGDVQVILSHSLVPLLELAATGGSIRVVDVAAAYPMLENCAVRVGYDVNANGNAALKGARVALPFGTTTEFLFLRFAQTASVDLSTLEIFNLSPSLALAELERGNLDIACGWGQNLSHYYEYATPLLSAEKKEEMGLKVFDVTLANSDFALNNSDFMRSFLDIVEAQNAAFRANPEPATKSLAAFLGMSEAATADILAHFEFPTREAKLSSMWFDGGLSGYLTEVSAFLNERGTLSETLGDFAPLVVRTYLEAPAPETPQQETDENTPASE